VDTVITKLLFLSILFVAVIIAAGAWLETGNLAIVEQDANRNIKHIPKVIVFIYFIFNYKIEYSKDPTTILKLVIQYLNCLYIYLFRIIVLILRQFLQMFCNIP